MIIFASAGGGNISLPNPLLGDPDQFNLGTVYKISMSKKIHSTKQHATISTFLFNFVNLTQAKWEEFEVWWKASQGDQIGYLDPNFVLYVGIIKNEPLEIVITGRRNCGAGNIEHGSITVEFEGQLW